MAEVIRLIFRNCLITHLSLNCWLPTPVLSPVSLPPVEPITQDLLVVRLCTAVLFQLHVENLPLSLLFLTAPPDPLAGLCVSIFSLNEQCMQTAMQQVELTTDGTAVQRAHPPPSIPLSLYLSH